MSQTKAQLIDAVDGSIVTADIADGAINNAKVNASAAIARTKLANVDLVDDTSPQLGGDLQSNGNDIDFADNDKAIFGTGGDLEIYHSSSNSFHKRCWNRCSFFRYKWYCYPISEKAHQKRLQCLTLDGAIELFHDGAKIFQTTGAGITVGLSSVQHNGND